MAISLQKGGNISLSKQAPGLKNVEVGLGWDAKHGLARIFQAGFDLDASVFMLGKNGKLPTPQHIVYYGNLDSPDKSVRHLGDNLTGKGEGDDEVIKVDLTQLQDNILNLVFTVTIYQAETRKQNFGMLENAFIRVVNQENGEEITRYDLGEEFSNEAAMIFGELYRYKGDWHFRAVGQGFDGGLTEMIRASGISERLGKGSTTVKRK